jgi:carbon starvation protein
LIFVPLVFLAIPLGQEMPIEGGALAALCGAPTGWDPALLWSLVLVVYCYAASVAPVWLLLQPRDYLSSYLLYATVVASAAGLILGGFEIAYPAYLGFRSPLGPLFPILFVTIACGSVSGFHSVISSGTTAKQIAGERAARPIGYGAMIAEGVVALIALATVILLAGNSALIDAYRSNEVSAIGVFTAGMGRFVEALGLPGELGSRFGALAISTFLLTTLDTCTRLGRFLLHEFFGIRRVRARYLSSAVTVLLPALFLFLPFRDADGNPVPAWKAIWPVFGTANQMLAALGLLIVTVWARRRGRSIRWVAPPTVAMVAITLTSLVMIVTSGTQSRAVEAVSAMLFLLAILLIAMGLRSAARRWITGETGVEGR